MKNYEYAKSVTTLRYIFGSIFFITEEKINDVGSRKNHFKIIKDIVVQNFWLKTRRSELDLRK